MKAMSDKQINQILFDISWDERNFRAKIRVDYDRPGLYQQLSNWNWRQDCSN